MEITQRPRHRRGRFRLPKKQNGRVWDPPLPQTGGSHEPPYRVCRGDHWSPAKPPSDEGGGICEANDGGRENGCRNSLPQSPYGDSPLVRGGLWSERTSMPVVGAGHPAGPNMVQPKSNAVAFSPKGGKRRKVRGKHGFPVERNLEENNSFFLRKGGSCGILGNREKLVSLNEIPELLWKEGFLHDQEKADRG